jgi:high affinity Mn2+ porin
VNSERNTNVTELKSSPRSSPLLSALSITVVSIWFALALDCSANAVADQEITAATRTNSEPQAWNFHAQSTFVGEGHSGFDAKYSGANSLRGHSEFKETLSIDLMAGVQLWRGAGFYVDGLMWQGFGLSDTVGVAGFPNGEAFRLGTEVPNVNFTRVFLQQTFGLGGEEETVEDDALQLAGKRDISRITVRLGKFGAKDVFDQNAYSDDPRTQFLNWALMANGAWDYPADALGFVPGLTLDLNQPQWAARYGIFMVPRVANGVALDTAVFRAWSMAWELERRYALASHPGAVRFLTFLTRAHMGSYEATVADPTLDSDITLTREYRFKFGFGLNAEQEISKNLGVFLRAGWNDGQTETWMFTDIDRSLSLGLSLKGAAWHRPNDTVGMAGVLNEISGEHRAFLAAGGHGITVGDGTLNYGAERILETYYDFQIFRQLRAALDYQFVNHPAYNRDRGTGVRFWSAPALGILIVSLPLLSKQKQRRCRAEHNDGRQSDDPPVQGIARLTFHQFFVGSDNQNPDEQKRSQNAIHNGRPEQCFNGIETDKIETNSQRGRKDHDKIKSFCGVQLFIETLFPAKCFGEGVRGRAGQGWNRQKTDRNNAQRVEKRGKIPSQRS